MLQIQKIKIWVDALRSGAFKQSRRRYHGSKGGHCCLGVGQVVLGLPKLENSRDLRACLGLKPSDTAYLIKLNDKGHRNFAYIADRIEKRFLTKSA